MITTPAAHHQSSPALDVTRKRQDGTFTRLVSILLSYIPKPQALCKVRYLVDEQVIQRLADNMTRGQVQSYFLLLVWLSGNGLEAEPQGGVS